MKTRIVLIVMLGLVGLSGRGQVMFQKTYGGIGGDYGESVLQTTDGGYIIAGYTAYQDTVTLNHIYDFILTKTDSYGAIQWSKTFTQPNLSWDMASTVLQTNDGGFIIGGTSFDGFETEIYIIKTNNNGDTLWSKIIGAGTSDMGPVFIQKTSDDGYIVFANRVDNSHFFNQIWITKLDSIGGMQWYQTIDDYNLGQSSQAGQQTSDGGYVITGIPSLVKTNATGNPLWNKFYAGAVGNVYANSVKQTNDGGYVVGGFTADFGAGGYDIYINKTDSVGTLIWSKTYGGSRDDYSYSIQQTTDGGFIIAGKTYSFEDSINGDVYLIKTDSNGNLLWSKTYGGTGLDEANSVQQTVDGGFIISGTTNSFDSVLRIYFIKTDANGNSGCNENNPSTIVTSPFTIVSTDIHIGLDLSSGSDNSVTTTIGTGVFEYPICLSSSINEIAQSPSLLLSPNPFTTQAILTLQGSYHHPTLYIYNLLGQEVETLHGTSLPNQQIIIPRNNLPAGMYFYKVMEDNKEVIGVGKLIISE